MPSNTPPVNTAAMEPLPPPPERSGEDVAASRRVAWTPEVAWRAGRVVLGGSPWAVTVIPESMREFTQRAFAAGSSGITPATDTEKQAARLLLDRGIVHPLPEPAAAVTDVEIVIPVYGDAAPLERCLASLADEGLPITVVDDASPEPHATKIAALAEAHGARLIRHDTNLGPGGARNTGMAATTAPFVAFIDDDAYATPGWIAKLRPILDDERVGAVGPRVRPGLKGTSAIELYEETRSELDMGPLPSKVVHGVAVGWLPSAAVLVRRAATSTPPFEPGLRVGEDVDLFWRMDETGWTVLYAPHVVVYHEVRLSWRDFSGRRAMYGSSAAPLELRHPGRLTPASPHVSGLAALVALATKRPLIAGAIGVYEVARYRAMLGPRVPLRVVIEVAARSMWSDAYWTGHLLRRDWWPIGWSALALAPRSRIARGFAAAMLWQPVRDHLLRPTRLDPARSLAMRLLDDASYGGGVIRNAIRYRVANVVRPRPRFPSWPKRRLR